MAKTNFSPGRYSRTRKGAIRSSRQGPSRIPLGFEYELAGFNYKIPKGVTGGGIFTFEEVASKLKP